VLRIEPALDPQRPGTPEPALDNPCFAWNAFSVYNLWVWPKQKDPKRSTATPLYTLPSPNH
jgi:hypothetical protein